MSTVVIIGKVLNATGNSGFFSLTTYFNLTKLPDALALAKLHLCF